ncbi:Uncharacterised protein [Burkholderia pseudomallei]|nr:hypothetical protein [Burkholderia pseudomallei]CAJ7658821.1 Uncharacterised protein [Burkholderia pseudomallei]VBY42010.1 Uncharacterised protein [Burkholderia pseudomallei]VBY61477.1 Uncharacterised protein [Burkholderia pseudomallei]VBY67199.1 Uncharacterised protein [Burkholderia pseudomallei]VBY70229.1 Uncharacterised protein [Burkholderia pseudomallei]
MEAHYRGLTMSLRTERWYPYAIAGAVGVAWWQFKLPLPAAVKEFLSAAISVGAILTGFIATAQAILAALPTDTVVGRLRASGYIEDLINYLACALYGCLIFSAFSIAGFFLIWNEHLPSWYGPVWIAMAVFSALSFHRVSRIFFKILRWAPPM